MRAHLLPGPVAQEAPQQAPPAAAGVRRPAGAQAAPGWPPALRDRLGGLRRADVGCARRHRRPGQPCRPAWQRAAPGLAPADPLRDPWPEARPGRLGPVVRPHLTIA
ncbi:hypothetical protein G6F63_016085 [Rhizopus arrhizus]|nr:hypothetical protein G6F63_016085 [Rhizopus arrhizus]